MMMGPRPPKSRRSIGYYLKKGVYVVSPLVMTPVKAMGGLLVGGIGLGVIASVAMPGTFPTVDYGIKMGFVGVSMIAGPVMMGSTLLSFVQAGGRVRHDLNQIRHQRQMAQAQKQALKVARKNGVSMG